MSAAMQKVGGTGLRRFKPYPEYKDSGVEWLGKIPAHWACSRLRYVTHLNPIKTEVRDLDPLLPVSFVPMEAVGEYGGLRLDAVKPLAATRDGFTYFRDGDVIVAKITPCFENGKGALALGLENGIAFGTTELHVLRARPGADARFVFYVTLSDHFRRLGASTMYGAGGQKRISEEFILNLRHPLPSELEQRAIAAFLDCETARIDALVAKKERLIELLQEKRAALITRAVTKGLDPNVPMKDSGVEWLGEIPAHWDVWSVRNLLRRRFVQVQDGNHGELHPIAEDYVPAGIPFLMATDIHGGRIDLVGCHFIAKAQADKLRIGFAKPGDVLLTHKGTIGATAIVPEAIDSPYIMLTPQVTKNRCGFSQKVERRVPTWE